MPPGGPSLGAARSEPAIRELRLARIALSLVLAAWKAVGLLPAHPLATSVSFVRAG